MKLTWLLPAILGGLLLFTSSVNDPAPAPAVQPAPQAVAEPAALLPDVPLFDAAAVADTPVGILLDVNEGGRIDPMQARGTQPPNWKPDPPLNLSGPMPSDDEVRGALVKAVNYVLDHQNENGSWDVELTGTLLSETADQAVDAIAATGLAGYALRRHLKVNPERIEPALKRAAQFVIDRVYRGKLPLKVWYANWRYTLGLKFLHQEYMNTADPEFRNELRSVCRRMVQGLLKLQLSNSEAPALEKKRRTRLSSRFKNSAMPSQLGVVLAPRPTKTTAAAHWCCACCRAVRPSARASRPATASVKRKACASKTRWTITCRRPASSAARRSTSPCAARAPRTSRRTCSSTRPGPATWASR
ncbi:MAG: hypothetical protein M5U25_14935 [Planctomycetota bacterium]|nr:hypothetical protein [Planctomycetota bacterium]